MLAGIGSVVVLLYVGRWGVTFLAERWWAATISPAALRAVTRWQLLGLALDTFAVLVASCWFALQALLVARTVATVSITSNVGNLQRREAVPPRLLWITGLATGVLLGLITGAGARAWRGPVALAWQGIQYDVVDPLLGEDLGVFVAQLPLWNLAHDFVVTLVVLGLAVTAMLYSGIGGITRAGNRVAIHPEARRHLGFLLMMLAAVIAVGYLIEPYRLVSTADLRLGAMALLTRIRAARVMAGLAFGVATLSVLWAQRGRHALLAGGWCALIVGALVERVVIPVLASDSAPPSVTAAEVRQFESIAWGIREVPAPVRIDTIPMPTTVWDESMLLRWLEADGRSLLGANAGGLSATDAPLGGWLVASTAGSDRHRVEVLGVAEGSVRSDGGPLLSPHATDSDSSSRLLSLADPRLRPDASAWRASPTGVSPGGPVRRLALAWARQAWGMMAPGNATAVDWHLNPSDRAAAIVPMATWLQPTPVLVEGRLVWVVQGMVALQVAPHSTRAQWWGRDVAGVVPAFVATMDAVSGAVNFFLDPGADSIAASWSRFAPGLIAPSVQLPQEVRDGLPYPAGWLAAQLAVLEGVAWGLGRRPGLVTADGPAETPVVAWRSPGGVSRVAVFEDPGRRVLSAVVTASRIDGVPQLEIVRLGRTAILNGRELTREWALNPILARLRDSAAASGDSVVSAPIRWHVGAAGLVAWQPVFAFSASGRPALLGLGGAMGGAIGVAALPEDLWGRLQGKGEVSGGSPGSEAGRLSAARGWLRQADSALARHDLTAFGRAFEELRKVLAPPPHE